MTRTLARMGTAVGSLGLALAYAGTAAAAAVPVAPVKAAASTVANTVVANTPPPCPPHHGLVSGLLIDVFGLVGHLLGALL